VINSTFSLIALLIADLPEVLEEPDEISPRSLPTSKNSSYYSGMGQDAFLY